MINVVGSYLDINNYSNLKNNFRDLFLSHPNFPSLYAVTDSLSLMSIDNLAIKVPNDQFGELPDSFLAFYKNDMVLVAKKESFLLVENEKGTKQKMTVDEFLAGWDGIVVAIEPNEKTSQSSVLNNSWWKVGIPVVLLVLLSVFYNTYDFSSVFFLLSSAVGLILSILIVQEKLGVENTVVAKICNINSATSCDSVIKSKKSDINSWLSFADLPLIFFSVNWFSILLFPATSRIIGLLSLVALPVIVYSLWIQKFQIKKWCVLCLAVSSVVAIQVIVFISSHGVNINATFPGFFFYSFSFVAIASVWLSVRPVLEKKAQAENANNVLRRFKNDYKIFNFLSKEINDIAGFSELQGITIGNPSADVKLTLIVSPSCGHCHKAFQDASELLTRYREKLTLNILFNVNPENESNPYRKVVETLLAINYPEVSRAEEAIKDWHGQKLGLEPWLKKWNVNPIQDKVYHQMYLQYEWCQKNEFNYTPVKIVNDKLFPEGYDLGELKYFLNDLTAKRDVSEMVKEI